MPWAQPASPPGPATVPVPWNFSRREAAARAAKLGLWASSYYDLLDAENLAGMLAGKVVSVRESGAIIYVNFGRRWSQDFTLTILKRNARNFTAAGLEPGKLAGRRIRVRGWIEQRGRPWIEASRPEQIESRIGSNRRELGPTANLAG